MLISMPISGSIGHAIGLGIIPNLDSADEFVSVEDDGLIEKVFEEFKKNYDGEYEFE